MFESYLKPPISFPTLTGSIITFNSQYAGLPLKSHTIALPASLSGYSAINISQSGADISTPTVYTIQIGSTFYAFSYNAITGEFLGTFKGVTFDGSSDENWTISNSGTESFYYSISNSIPDPIGTASNSLCNLFDYATIGNTGSTIGFFITSGKVIRIRDESEKTITDWRTWLSNNNVTIAYPLESPISLQLSPCNIETRIGENNIWSDGDTTLHYIKLG